MAQLRPDKSILPPALLSFFAGAPRVALAFSGGVDSALLLYAAVACGAAVRPYFVNTPFQPAFELADARRLCDELAVELAVLELDILAVRPVAANPADRCYHCKKEIFGAIRAAALAEGYMMLIDGSNASDDATDRPGMRALEELAVRSPLREAGLPKAEVRRLSKQAGLFTWDKPAYACLATRVPTGTPLTAAALARVERAEEGLKALGFSDLRVRLEGSGRTAKLQLPAGQLEAALARREEILKLLEADFEAVVLDLRPR